MKQRFPNIGLIKQSNTHTKGYVRFVLPHVSNAMPGITSDQGLSDGFSCKDWGNRNRDELLPSRSCLSVDRLDLLQKSLKETHKLFDPDKLSVGNSWSVSWVNPQTQSSKLRAWAFFEYQPSYWFDWDREILSHDCWDKLKLDWWTDTTLSGVLWEEGTGIGNT